MSKIGPKSRKISPGAGLDAGWRAGWSRDANTHSGDRPFCNPRGLEWRPNGPFWDPLKTETCSDVKILGRASRVTLGKRAIGSCWAKGPAAVGIRGWLGKVGPYGPEWPKGLWGDGMGAFGAHGANGAFGGYSEAIPSGWCLTSGGNRFGKFCGIP